MKRMLIDATMPGEVHVAVTDGNYLLDYDFEDTSKRPTKGNIYLSAVSRVEPSLQAAFLEYGSERMAFLPMPEVHVDYYKIPTADRERLTAALRAIETEENDVPLTPAAAPDALDERLLDDLDVEEDYEVIEEGEPNYTHSLYDSQQPLSLPTSQADIKKMLLDELMGIPPADYIPVQNNYAIINELLAEQNSVQPTSVMAESRVSHQRPVYKGRPGYLARENAEATELQMARERRNLIRNYKIQEVIKRRQVMLVQITKEERGTKGAAATSYISLAGRYCVLMPNAPSAGGVSRKISNPNDRRRLKEVLSDLRVPDGMSVILRTAGLEADKGEIARDLTYLLRLWDSIREVTLKSNAPALVYEEGDLIKRSIRDLYTDEIGEILIAGNDAYQEAQRFMQILLPEHTGRVKLYDQSVPLFARYGVDQQITDLHNPLVQLPSGGYLVIHQTEALVAIDVNSGRATRERNIEETAYRTNLEAAVEAARQIRLRDLAGLIVIDFIDMEDARHRIGVERRMRDAMKIDRARYQTGRISSFGLMELSRQRLRPSVVESHFMSCPHCQGSGYTRAPLSTARQLLRALEADAARAPQHRLTAYAHPQVALLLLNDFRLQLHELESKYNVQVRCQSDEQQVISQYRIERARIKMNPLPAPRANKSLDQSSVVHLDDVDLYNLPAAMDEEGAFGPVTENQESLNPVMMDEGSDEDGGRGRNRRSRRGGRGRGRGRGNEGSDESVTVSEDMVGGTPTATGRQRLRDRQAIPKEASFAAESSTTGMGEAEAHSGRSRQRRGRNGSAARERGTTSAVAGNEMVRESGLAGGMPSGEALPILHNSASISAAQAKGQGVTHSLSAAPEQIHVSTPSAPPTAIANNNQTVLPDTAPVVITTNEGDEGSRKSGWWQRLMKN